MSAQQNITWLREGAHIDEMVEIIQPPSGVTVSQITIENTKLIEYLQFQTIKTC